MRRSTFYGLLLVTFTAGCAAVSLAIFVLTNPNPPELPVVSREQSYRLFKIDGECEFNLYYPGKQVPDQAIISSSFDKVMETYERNLYRATADEYYKGLPFHSRVRILVFGFSEVDQREIKSQYARYLRDEYPLNLVWQIWGLCQQLRTVVASKAAVL